MADQQERGRPGRIRGVFGSGHISRDAVRDELTSTVSIHDDMIDRGFKMVSAELDETGFFLIVRFAKRDD